VVLAGGVLPPTTPSHAASTTTTKPILSHKKKPRHPLTYGLQCIPSSPEFGMECWGSRPYVFLCFLSVVDLPDPFSESTAFSLALDSKAASVFPSVVAAPLETFKTPCTQQTLHTADPAHST
jgi:hypothetical protein